MAVAHVVPHGRRPLQGAVAVGIIAVGLRARGLQEMLVDLVGLFVQAHHVHFMGDAAHLEGKSAPHVLALSTGTRPPARHRSSAASGTCTCMGGSSTFGNGGRGVPAGQVDSLTSRMTSSQEAASRCSRVSLANAFEVLGRQFRGELPGGFPAAGLRHENAVLPESGSVRPPGREGET